MVCTHPRGTAKAMETICTESAAASERRIVDRKVIVVMKSIPRIAGMKSDEVTD